MDLVVMRNFKQFLKEETLIDVKPKDIKIENGKMLPNQFPNKVNNFYCYNLKKLTSLENCPQEIEGNFWCTSSSITSLEHAPLVVKDSFSCIGTKITSLEHAPLKCSLFYCSDTSITSLEHAPLKCEEFYCCGNDIKSLKGIGRFYLKECEYIALPDTIESNILGLCKVNKVLRIDILDKNNDEIRSGKLYEVMEIVKRHLGTSGEECAEELRQNGYSNYAKF